jgi:hypothetical protein
VSHEGDEPCAVYEQTSRTARKQHTCDACGSAIAVGQRYAYVFLIWDGARYQYRRCPRCEAIHAHLRAKCSAECGGRWPDEELNCGEDYADNWGEEPPPEISALAFWLPGDPLPAVKP